MSTDPPFVFTVKIIFIQVLIACAKIIIITNIKELSMSMNEIKRKEINDIT